MTYTYWSVPPLWEGQTVVVIGGGPSISRSLCLSLQGHCRVVALNDSYLLAPWCDLHYFADLRWWRWHIRGYEGRPHPAVSWVGCTLEQGRDLLLSLKCIRATIQDTRVIADEYPELNFRILMNDSLQQQDGVLPVPLGLCMLRHGVKSGGVGGYQVLNLLYHLGVSKIILLGYEMREVDGRTHWFGHHPPGKDALYGKSFIESFEHIARPLKRRGVDVVNCTPHSAIVAFRFSSLWKEL